MEPLKTIICRVPKSTWVFFKQYSAAQDKSMASMVVEFIESKKKFVEKKSNKNVDSE